MRAAAVFQQNLLADFFFRVYRYREYLRQSVLRDLRVKYKRSFLGYIWTMLHPLCMMTILGIVFSHIMKIPMKDYVVFLFPGLLAWNYFNSTVMMSLGNIRANARLFGQIPLPKYIFITSLLCSNLINFLLACFPLLLVMFVLGRPISGVILALPIVIVPLVFVTMGISLLLATSSVFFEDTLHLSEVLLQGLYFLSPVLYHRELLPPNLVRFLVLNPLFCQIEFIRGLFYSGIIPDPAAFFVNVIGSLLILLVGLKIFTEAESKFLYFV